MVPYKATVVGFGGAIMVGSRVWGVPNNTHQNIERQIFLGLKWPKLNEKTQQPAGN